MSKNMHEFNQINPLNIAQAKQLIIDSLAEIGYEPDDYADEDLRDLLNSYNDNYDIMLVMEEDKNVIGVAAMKDQGGGTGELRRFYVRSELRKQGNEEALLYQLIRYARSKGFEDLYILILAQRDSLIDFFKQHQFKEDTAASSDTHIFLERHLDNI